MNNTQFFVTLFIRNMSVRVWSPLLRKRNWMETKRWSKGFLFCDNSHIVKIYFLSLSNTQDNICINIHFDHISIKDEVHISTHEVMFASNRRLKLESFTSHSSSNFALQINVIFVFLVLSQTLPFVHLWPKSPSLRPFSLGPPGNKQGVWKYRPQENGRTLAYNMGSAFSSRVGLCTGRNFTVTWGGSVTLEKL